MNLQQSSIENHQKALLIIRDLKTYFYTAEGVVKAVDGIDLDVHPGEVLGLVGESGCGKSVASLSIMRLIDRPGRIVSGEIFYHGKDLLKLSKKEMTEIRSKHISMIFQQPQTALNPIFRVGGQIAEVLKIHGGRDRHVVWQRTIELLHMVGIPAAEKRARAFPFELSGGMAQRIMIAMALACVPELLIADEPTTALDVTIQAQILDLMQELRIKTNAALILITHDMGVISDMADRVAVMYAGRILEQANVLQLFKRPLHPYTQGLMASTPVLGKITEMLNVIPGTVPNLINLPSGCRFAPRCQYCFDKCHQKEPDLIDAELGHQVRCWLIQND
jgi:peptide/nickel transport system ATP-binding protein